MADRETTDRDTDLEFEFFEDLPTSERQAPEQRGPRRPIRPPSRPRTPGSGGGGPGTPLARLAVLIGGAVVLAVVIILWVTSCGSGGEKEAYQDYMSQVGAVVNESDAIGAKLGTVITTRGASLDDVESQLAGLAQQQAQVVGKASELVPPGQLASEQQSFVEAMQLRESGLAGLQQAFSQVQLATEPAEAGTTLAAQAARLVAAGVVYDDLFRARSQEVMQAEGISGVAVPESSFLGDPDLVSQTSLTAFVKRLTQGGGGTDGAAGPGLHGNSIDSVVVQPADQTLSQTQENTVAASDSLSFDVGVKNSGDFQETQVEVTLVIQFAGGPIRKTQTIDVVNQNQTKVVSFTDFANITFGEPTTLKVSVQPVPGEENTSNNVVEYPIIFTLE